MTDPNGEPRRTPDRPSRLETEIAEILERTEQPASFTEHVRRKARARPPRPSVSPPSMPSLHGLGPGSFLIGALLFAALGAAIHGPSPLLATLFAIVSFVSFAMIWVRRAPPGINSTKTWRGRDLDLGPSPPPWVKSLRDRFRGPPRF
ncbi:MAG: hypothetical protein M3464_14560 [Chloroflexota bacterium]|nr:hypothetical protein [Chloroflexota bacterium]